ncbi:MAG TPA: glycosyltransferase family 2 protein [Hanamia sp.]|nr:glycosyltransferase family 2 protein [Hanamia sp.]
MLEKEKPCRSKCFIVLLPYCYIAFFSASKSIKPTYFYFTQIPIFLPLQLSVIIVNYNVKYFLETCLLSVLKAMQNIDGEIIVIDNHSTDGSFDFFKNRFPGVKFVWKNSNDGFAKANNEALKHAKGDYILFLNPDTIIPEDCFEKCISFLKSRNDDGALGIKMLDGSGRFLKESKRAFPSPSTSFFKMAGLSKLFPRSKTFARYHLGNLSENENHKVEVLAGAFMLIPKKILDTTGGFDERFFMYGEDIDLSYRIQKAGFSNFYFAESSIIHFKGESTKKGSLNYVQTFYSAMRIFVKKHYGQSKGRFFLLCLDAAIFLRGSVSAFSRIGKKLFRKRKAIDQKPMFIVAGSESEIESINIILKAATPKAKIAERIDPGKISEYNFNYLNKKEAAANAIIFCEGTLSFKQIIKVMQQVAASVPIKIFAHGSHAIIGSNSKNDPGDVIAQVG